MDQASAFLSYNPPNLSQQHLDEIRERLEQQLCVENNSIDVAKFEFEAADLESLRVHSMKKDFSLNLLTQFYNDLMVPHFPLEDELDSLEDWVYCLDPEQIAAYDEEGRRGPIMDILILLCDATSFRDNDTDGDGDGDGEELTSPKPVIFAGVAFEYYQDAQVGLVSYVVVDDQFQKNGIMKRLHPLAVSALQSLHEFSRVHRGGGDNTSHMGVEADNDYENIRAILAETNTVDAGDASVEKIRERHACLYKLGYRLLEFPYIQPPLGTDLASFDTVMLLVYQGARRRQDEEEENTHSNQRSIDCELPSIIPYSYVLDFFRSVYGYRHEPQVGAVVSEEFKTHWYYKVATWFVEKYKACNVKSSLPWDDVTDYYRNEYDDHIHHVSNGHNLGERTHRKGEEAIVAIVGAGAAGLAAATELAKINSTTPLQIKLIEANSFVGGRIRTVLTNTNGKDQYVSPELANDCKKFAPWPVPIGAEFIHGVNSIVNSIMEEKGVCVEETFDLCSSIEEYPAQNSFSARQETKCLSQERRTQKLVKVFVGEQCFDLKNPSYGLEMGNAESFKFAKLVSKAKLIWDCLYELGEDFARVPTHPGPPLSDKTLSSFVEEHMQDYDEKDIETVKSIMDALYAKTAGSSVGYFGVNEGAREEVSWDYSECNWRSANCFGEIVSHFLDTIDDVNLQYQEKRSQTRIEVVTSTPIVAVTNSSASGNSSLHKVSLRTKGGKIIHCDKVVIAVPLSILKTGKIKFEGEYSLPPGKHVAIESINMFSGMKAHLLLRKNIDVVPSQLLEDTELFFCPGEIFAQVWLRRDESSVFLTGFVVADDRDLLLSRIKEGEEAEQIFLEQIRRMTRGSPSTQQGDSFRHPIPTCSAFMLHDWAEDEFTMGLYSSPSIGAGWKNRNGDDDHDENSIGTAIGTMRHDLRGTIRGTIFFAGEHTNVKACATVQAAIESGIIAARGVNCSILSRSTND